VGYAHGSGKTVAVDVVRSDGTVRTTFGGNPNHKGRL
jgi:hypothetical protein